MRRKGTQKSTKKGGKTRKGKITVTSEKISRSLVNSSVSYTKMRRKSNEGGEESMSETSEDPGWSSTIIDL